jgi:hypothetical protein
MSGDPLLKKQRPLCVSVCIGETITSTHAFEGSMLPITVAKEVVLDGTTLLHKGDRGYVFIAYVAKEGGHGKGGVLVIDEGFLTGPNQAKYPLTMNLSLQGKSQRALAWVLSILGLCTALIPAGRWVKGKPALLLHGSQWDAFVTVPQQAGLNYFLE